MSGDFFPTYGDGPFEAIGVRTTAPLLAGFPTVCARAPVGVPLPTESTSRLAKKGRGSCRRCLGSLPGRGLTGRVAYDFGVPIDDVEEVIRVALKTPA
ncbi:MAG: hypothetical protein M3O70_00310 [Actinomycetota bacterium]|nr:hypothetical protein [Actinomycetota bacterium]